MKSALPLLLLCFLLGCQSYPDGHTPEKKISDKELEIKEFIIQNEAYRKTFHTVEISQDRLIMYNPSREPVAEAYVKKLNNYKIILKWSYAIAVFEPGDVTIGNYTINGHTAHFELYEGHVNIGHLICNL